MPKTTPFAAWFFIRKLSQKREIKMSFWIGFILGLLIGTGGTMVITQDHIKRMAEEILRQQKYIEALEAEVAFNALKE